MTHIIEIAVVRVKAVTESQTLSQQRMPTRPDWRGYVREVVRWNAFELLRMVQHK